jgi:FtsH-binding integral membrane protein
MYHGDDLEQFAAGAYDGEPAAEPRTAIFGALTVYLDFVLLLLLVMSALGRLNEREAVED